MVLGNLRKLRLSNRNSPSPRSHSRLIWRNNHLRPTQLTLFSRVMLSPRRLSRSTRSSQPRQPIPSRWRPSHHNLWRLSIHRNLRGIRPNPFNNRWCPNPSLPTPNPSPRSLWLH